MSRLSQTGVSSRCCPHDLTAATAQPDLSEDLQVHTVAFAEALDMVLSSARSSTR